jgi:hypothetical protein
MDLDGAIQGGWGWVWLAYGLSWLSLGSYICWVFLLRPFHSVSRALQAARPEVKP